MSISIVGERENGAAYIAKVKGNQNGNRPHGPDESGDNYTRTIGRVVVV